MARCLNVLLLVAVFVATTAAQTFSCPTTNLTVLETVNGSLTFGQPVNCSRTSCDVYITMAVNPFNSSYLDIYMEANAAGWVAVGFSDSQAMADTDVIGCRVNSGSTVSVVDTWNPSPNYSPNQLDANQDGVCTHSANFTGSRISCLLSRYAKAINTDQDLDLDMPRFIIYGTRSSSNGAAMNLLQHTGTPQRTSSMVNPFIGGDTSPAESYPRKQLIQTHGILMLIAWPILAVVGIFFASWTRPALPNGEWFQIHRALMVGSLVVAIVGFIFAFVANATQSPPGLVNVNSGISVTHLVFGILVVALQIANPIIALFRCKPDSPNRWIFGISHAFMIGVGADVLAMINVGLGLVLFHTSFGGDGVMAPFWLFIVYIICYLVLEGALHVVFTIVALKSPPEDRPKLAPTSFRSCFSPPPKPADEGSEMKSKEEDGNKPAAAPQRKPPSKDHIIRWIAVGILLFFTLLVVIAAILVAAT